MILVTGISLTNSKSLSVHTEQLIDYVLEQDQKEEQKKKKKKRKSK
jgi:hypothetical protein